MRRTSLLLATLVIGSCLVAGPSHASGQFVLSPEGNNFWAYDAATGAKQLVVEGVNNREPGMTATSSERRDVNGQVCLAPDGRHVVTGEDTVVPTGTGGDSSHDPNIAGWGYWDIAGSTLSTITVTQTGKLAPQYGNGPGYAGDPDNFGCGFLDANRLFTTAIGNTLPGEAATGQLFLWFGSQGFTNNYRSLTTANGDTYYAGDVDHCAIDSSIATAGGIAIDGNDVYVASNRFDDSGDAGTVWRFHGDPWPSTFAECTPAFVAAHVTKTAVLDILPPPVPFEPVAMTPSAVVLSPQGTLYVSSVFTGTVSEFAKDGTFIRDVYPLSPVAPRTPPTGATPTPFGLTFTSDGSLWIANLGIVLADPVTFTFVDADAGHGSVIRQPFDGANNPVPLGATTVNDGLDYPDGLGVYTPA